MYANRAQARDDDPARRFVAGGRRGESACAVEALSRPAQPSLQNPQRGKARHIDAQIAQLQTDMWSAKAMPAVRRVVALRR